MRRQRGGEHCLWLGCAQASAIHKLAFLATWVQVTVPETYAVFKTRLLDLIYDRAVQIQPAAALQASGAVAVA